MRAVSLTCFGLAALFAVPAAFAQQVHTTGQPGRVAGIAPAPPAPPAPGSYRFHRVPVVVSPDGRVYADFGHGYEHLARNCATPLASFTQPAAQPSVTQPVVTQPTPYTPPVPNQQTASQQALGQAPGAQPENVRACWSTDTRGQPLIGR